MTLLDYKGLQQETRYRCRLNILRQGYAGRVDGQHISFSFGKSKLCPYVEPYEQPRVRLSRCDVVIEAPVIRDFSRHDKPESQSQRSSAVTLTLGNGRGSLTSSR